MASLSDRKCTSKFTSSLWFYLLRRALMREFAPKKKTKNQKPLLLFGAFRASPELSLLEHRGSSVFHRSHNTKGTAPPTQLGAEPRNPAGSSPRDAFVSDGKRGRIHPSERPSPRSLTRSSQSSGSERRHRKRHRSVNIPGTGRHRQDLILTFTGL